MQFIIQLVCNLLTSIGKIITHMDSTQWGIMAGLFVAVGFAALRSRL
ncbi:MAG: hypothetical protein U0930_24405 [Pirellulales bacterium]